MTNHFSSATRRSTGTLRWQAPELFGYDGDEELVSNTKATDIYAYAMVCWEVCSDPSNVDMVNPDRPLDILWNSLAREKEWNKCPQCCERRKTTRTTECPRPSASYPRRCMEDYRILLGSKPKESTCSNRSGGTITCPTRRMHSSTPLRRWRFNIFNTNIQRNLSPFLLSFPCRGIYAVLHGP